MSALISSARSPIRTCVGCRRRAPVRDLARTARGLDGRLVVQREAPGRGAWICRDPHSGDLRIECVDLARRRAAWPRALRAPISDASIEALRATASERARIEHGAAADAAPSGRD